MNRLVAVLEKMPVSPVPPIESHRIAGQEPAHDRCDRNASRPHEEMHVRGHQSPCVTRRPSLLKQTGQAFKKILPVLIILKNASPFDSSDDDMMQGTGRINAGLPWHGFQLPLRFLLVNNGTTSPSSHILSKNAGTE